MGLWDWGERRYSGLELYIRLTERYILPGWGNMATKIECGLSLEVDDARAFHEYIEGLDDTEAGRDVIREALRLVKSEMDSC